MNKSFEIIKKNLINLGIRKGDVVMVHSSLSSMGYVEGGAITFINALLDVLTLEGTLLFPAFSYMEANETFTFNIKQNKVCVGLIPETFRNMAGVIRSMHPTHSVCAIGKYAHKFIDNHYLDDTPMGVHSPFRKLANYNGKILMLGCGLYCNSFIHAMEEIANVRYCLGDYVEYKLIDKDNNVTTKMYRPHYFIREKGEVIQKYARTLDVLNKNDYKFNKVHNADAYLLDAVILQEKVLNKLKENDLYFVDIVGDVKL